jgi:hypothetical protein
VAEVVIADAELAEGGEGGLELGDALLEGLDVELLLTRGGDEGDDVDWTRGVRWWVSDKGKSEEG